MDAKSFPKVKNVIVKRTKSGQRYLLHDKDSSGKDIYVTIPIVDTDTEKDYLRKIKECRIKLNSKKSDCSIESLINDYIKKKQLTEGSAYLMRVSLRGFSLDNERNEKMVLEVLNSGLKKSTIKNKISRIRSFFRWLVLGNKADGIRDPTVDISLKHVKTGRSRTLTPDEEELFLYKTKGLANNELKLMLLLAYYTGARISSIYAMTPKSIRNGKVYYYNVKMKKDYDYPVPINDKFTIALFKCLAERGFVFSTTYGCLKAQSWIFLNKLFGYDDNGETISVHSLRHTFATKAIQKGVPPEIVARLLDHSTPSTTLKIYAKHSEDQLNNAVARIFDL